MSQLATEHRNDAPRESALAVFAFWAIVQAIAVVIGRTDWQMTANADSGARQWSVEILLVAQIGVSAVLIYDLLADLRRLAMAFAIAFPFVQYATAGHGCIEAVRASAILAMWLVGLWGWRSAVPYPRVLMAIGATWTWGGAAVGYVLAEFAIGSPAASYAARISPLLNVAQFRTSSAIVLTAIHMAVGLAAFGLAKIARR